MRFLILFFILMVGLKLYGQTDSIERVRLLEKLQSKELSKVEYTYMLRKWDAAIAKDKYPDLPLYETGQIQYSYLTEFQGVSKEKIFNRILEWFSITYGLIPAYLYANLNDGKIICSNNIDIQNKISGTYTYILTIVDGKVFMEFVNLIYQEKIEGYYSGDIWISEKINIYKVDNVFPIILKSPENWDFYLKLLNTLDAHFNSDVNSLNDYIMNYDSRYPF